MISRPPAESPITWISSGLPNVHISDDISARFCRPYLRRQIYLHEPIALRAIGLWTQSSRVYMVHRMPEIRTQIDGSLRSPTLLIVKPRRTELGRTRSEGSQIEGIFFFCLCQNNDYTVILCGLTLHEDILLQKTVHLMQNWEDMQYSGIVYGKPSRVRA